MSTTRSFEYCHSRDCENLECKSAFRRDDAQKRAIEEKPDIPCRNYCPVCRGGLPDGIKSVPASPPLTGAWRAFSF